MFNIIFPIAALILTGSLVLIIALVVMSAPMLLAVPLVIQRGVLSESTWDN